MQVKKKVSSSSAVNAVGTYSLGEEIANAVTHGLAVLLSIAGLVLMISLLFVSRPALWPSSAHRFSVRR